MTAGRMMDTKLQKRDDKRGEKACFFAFICVFFNFRKIFWGKILAVLEKVCNFAPQFGV